MTCPSRLQGHQARSRAGLLETSPGDLLWRGRPVPAVKMREADSFRGSSIGRTSAFGAGCWRFEPSPRSRPASPAPTGRDSEPLLKSPAPGGPPRSIPARRSSGTGRCRAGRCARKPLFRQAAAETAVGASCRPCRRRLRPRCVGRDRRSPRASSAGRRRSGSDAGGAGSRCQPRESGSGGRRRGSSLAMRRSRSRSSGVSAMTLSPRLASDGSRTTVRARREGVQQPSDREQKHVDGTPADRAYRPGRFAAFGSKPGRPRPAQAEHEHCKARSRHQNKRKTCHL